jgi:hypothetical protein
MSKNKSISRATDTQGAQEAASEAFSQYREKYWAFIRAVHQTLFLSTVAQHSLGAFPKNLPPGVSQPIKQAFGKVSEAIAQRKKGVSGSDIVSATVSLPADGMDYALLALMIVLADSLNTSQARPIESLGENFQAMARYQALAMTFAHLDAFFAESLRGICRIRPEVLRIGKQLTWAHALSFATMNDLAESFAEQFVFEFGWQTIEQRLHSLEKNLGLQIPVTPKDLKVLSLHEQRRHLVIHNGGVITQKYLDDSGDTGAIGESVRVSDKNTRDVADAITRLGSSLFSSISQKFLGIKRQDIQLLSDTFESTEKSVT